MEGIVQLRMELSYSIYHIKDKCDEECEENLLRSIMIMINEKWINRKAKQKNS